MNKSKLIKSVAAVTICAATIAAITACASAAKPVGPAQNEPDIEAIAREDDQYIGGALEDINVDDLEDIDADDLENIDTDNLEDIDFYDWDDSDFYDWEDWDAEDWEDFDLFDWEDWDSGDLEDIDFYDSEDSDDCDDCEGCEDCWEGYEFDYGDLTEEEIAELEGLYDRFYAIYEQAIGDLDEEMLLEMSDDEWGALFTPFEAELEEIFSRMEELEEKAGLSDESFYDDESLDDESSDYGYYDDYEFDYGDLTEEEVAELEGLYDRFFEIFNQAVGDLDEETLLEMSDDEWEALFTPFEAELEEIFSRMEELEEKAGVYDEYSDEENFDNGIIAEENVDLL